MDRRPIGGTLMVAAVILIIGTAVAAILGLDLVAVDGPGYLLVVGCIALVGSATTILGLQQSGPVFGGALARRGLTTVGIGLLVTAAVLFQSTRPGFEGSKVMILFGPFIVFGWVTSIGALMTLVALLKAGGRARNIGLVFLMSPVALLVGNGLIENVLTADSGLGASSRPLIIVGGLVVCSPFLVGLHGLGLLAIDAPREGRRSVAAPR